MFQGFQLCPGDTVTTRFLQKARRSAERKGKPRLASKREDGQDSAKRSSTEKAQVDHHIIPTQSLCSELKQSKDNDILELEKNKKLCSLHEFALSQGWTLPALHRIWSFGFDCDHVSTLLYSLPPSLLRCFSHVSNTWDSILKTHSPEALQQKFGCWLDKDNVVATELDQNPFLCKLTMTFDASTQMRTGFVANGPLASMLAMNHDTLNHRLASYDLALPFCELDFVCIFLHQILRELTVPGVWRVKYLRLMSGNGLHQRCLLVRWCSLAQVDGDGRVVEVRYTCAACQPAPSSQNNQSRCLWRRRCLMCC